MNSQQLKNLYTELANYFSALDQLTQKTISQLIQEKKEGISETENVKKLTATIAQYLSLNEQEKTRDSIIQKKIIALFFGTDEQRQLKVKLNEDSKKNKQQLIARENELKRTITSANKTKSNAKTQDYVSHINVYVHQKLDSIICLNRYKEIQEIIKRSQKPCEETLPTIIDTLRAELANEGRIDLTTDPSFLHLSQIENWGQVKTELRKKLPVPRPQPSTAPTATATNNTLVVADGSNTTETNNSALVNNGIETSSVETSVETIPSTSTTINLSLNRPQIKRPPSSKPIDPEIALLQHEIQKNINALNKANEEIEELKQQLNKKTKEASNLKYDLEKNERKDNLIDRIRANIGKKTSSSSVNNLSESVTTAALALSDAQMSSVSEATLLRTKNEELKNALEETIQSRDWLREELDKILTEKESLENELRKQVTELKSQLTDEERSHKTLQIELTTQKDSLEKARIDYVELESSTNKTKGENLALEAQLKGTKGELKQTQTLLEEVKTEITQREDTLQLSLLAEKELTKTQKQRIKELEAAVNESKQLRIQSEKGSSAQLSTAISTATKTIEELTEASQTTKKDLESERAKSATLEVKITDLERNKKEEAKILNLRLDESKNENKTLQAEITKVRNEFIKAIKTIKKSNSATSHYQLNVEDPEEEEIETENYEARSVQELLSELISPQQLPSVSEQELSNLRQKLIQYIEKIKTELKELDKGIKTNSPQSNSFGLDTSSNSPLTLKKEVYEYFTDEALLSELENLIEKKEKLLEAKQKSHSTGEDDEDEDSYDPTFDFDDTEGDDLFSSKHTQPLTATEIQATLASNPTEMLTNALQRQGELEAALEVLKIAKTELEREKAEKEDEIKLLQTQKDELEQRPTQDTLEQIKEALEATKRKKDETNTEAQRLEKALNKANEQLHTEQTTLHNQQEELNKIKVQLEEKTQKLNELETKNKEETETFESTLKEQQQTIEQLKERETNSETAISATKAEIKQLQGDKANAEEKVEKITQDNIELNKKINAQQETIQQLEKETKESKELQIELQQKKETVDEQVRAKQEEILRLQQQVDELKKLETELQEKTHELEKLKADKETTENVLRDKSQKVDELTSTVTTTAVDNKRLEQELSQLQQTQEKIKELEIAKAQLEKEKNEEIQHVAKQVQDKQEEILSLQRQAGKLKKLETKLQEKTSELEKLKADKKTTENALHDKSQKVDELTSTVTTTEADNTRLEQELNQLRPQLQQANKEKDEKDKQVKQLQAKNAELEQRPTQEQLDQLNRQFEQANKKTEALEVAKTQLKKEKDKEIQQLAEQNDQLEQQLLQVKETADAKVNELQQENEALQLLTATDPSQSFNLNSPDDNYWGAFQQATETSDDSGFVQSSDTKTADKKNKEKTKKVSADTSSASLSNPAIISDINHGSKKNMTKEGQATETMPKSSFSNEDWDFFTNSEQNLPGTKRLSDSTLSLNSSVSATSTSGFSENGQGTRSDSSNGSSLQPHERDSGLDSDTNNNNKENTTMTLVNIENCEKLIKGIINKKIEEKQTINNSPLIREDFDNLKAPILETILGKINSPDRDLMGHDDSKTLEKTDLAQFVEANSNLTTNSELQQALETKFRSTIDTVVTRKIGEAQFAKNEKIAALCQAVFEPKQSAVIFKQIAENTNNALQHTLSSNCGITAPASVLQQLENTIQPEFEHLIKNQSTYNNLIATLKEKSLAELGSLEPYQAAKLSSDLQHFSKETQRLATGFGNNYHHYLHSYFTSRAQELFNADSNLKDQANTFNLDAEGLADQTILHFANQPPISQLTEKVLANLITRAQKNESIDESEITGLFDSHKAEIETAIKTTLNKLEAQQKKQVLVDELFDKLDASDVREALIKKAKPLLISELAQKDYLLDQPTATKLEEELSTLTRKQLASIKDQLKHQFMQGSLNTLTAYTKDFANHKNDLIERIIHFKASNQVKSLEEQAQEAAIQLVKKEIDSYKEKTPQALVAHYQATLDFIENSTDRMHLAMRNGTCRELHDFLQEEIKQLTRIEETEEQVFTQRQAALKTKLQGSISDEDKKHYAKAIGLIDKILEKKTPIKLPGTTIQKEESPIAVSIKKLNYIAVGLNKVIEKNDNKGANQTIIRAKSSSHFFRLTTNATLESDRQALLEEIGAEPSKAAYATLQDAAMTHQNIEFKSGDSLLEGIQVSNRASNTVFTYKAVKNDHMITFSVDSIHKDSKPVTSFEKHIKDKNFIKNSTQSMLEFAQGKGNGFGEESVGMLILNTNDSNWKERYILIKAHKQVFSKQAGPMLLLEGKITMASLKANPSLQKELDNRIKQQVAAFAKAAGPENQHIEALNTNTVLTAVSPTRASP
jgi:chromosome segregation ATPase